MFFFLFSLIRPQLILSLHLSIRCFNRNKIKIKRHFGWKTNTKKILFGRKKWFLNFQSVEAIATWRQREWWRVSKTEFYRLSLFEFKKKKTYSKLIVWYFRSIDCDIVLVDKSLSASYVFCSLSFADLSFIVKDSISAIHRIASYHIA